MTWMDVLKGGNVMEWIKDGNIYKVEYDDPGIEDELPRLYSQRLIILYNQYDDFYQVQLRHHPRGNTALKIQSFHAECIHDAQQKALEILKGLIDDERESWEHELKMLDDMMSTGA